MSIDIVIKFHKFDKTLPWWFFYRDRHYGMWVFRCLKCVDISRWRLWDGRKKHKEVLDV